MKMLRIILMALVSALAFAGCSKKAAPQTDAKEIYRETYKEVQVPVPGAEVSTGIDSAQLALILSKLSGGRDTVIYRDREGKVDLKFYLDELGNLKVACEAKDRYIEYLQKQVETERTNTKTVVETEYKTPVSIWLLVGGMGAALVYLTVKRFF